MTIGEMINKVRIRQRFHRGDVVKIGEMPPYMSHFPGASTEAVVVGSYHELCSPHSRGSVRDRDQYSLIVDGRGEVSWYDGCLLTLVRERDVNEVYVREIPVEVSK